MHLGGEVVTEGLRRRAQRLFGPVEIRQSYALTELVPFNGQQCGEGHVHFEPTSGLAEVRTTEFAAGSMGPKVAAACRFATATGKSAAIGALADLDRILAGETGTTISSKESGIVYGAGTTVSSRESGVVHTA